MQDPIHPAQPNMNWVCVLYRITFLKALWRKTSQTTAKTVTQSQHRSLSMQIRPPPSKQITGKTLCTHESHGGVVAVGSFKTFFEYWFLFFFFFFLDGKQDMNLLHANLFVFAPLPLAFALWRILMRRDPTSLRSTNRSVGQMTMWLWPCLTCKWLRIKRNMTCVVLQRYTSLNVDRGMKIDMMMNMFPMRTCRIWSLEIICEIITTRIFSRGNPSVFMWRAVAAAGLHQSSSESFLWYFFYPVLLLVRLCGCVTLCISSMLLKHCHFLAFALP